MGLYDPTANVFTYCKNCGISKTHNVYGKKLSEVQCSHCGVAGFLVVNSKTYEELEEEKRLRDEKIRRSQMAPRS